MRFLFGLILSALILFPLTPFAQTWQQITPATREPVDDGGSGPRWKLVSPVPPVPQNCTLDGVAVINGDSRIFYSAASHANCASVGSELICEDGTLDGSATYSYANCNTLYLAGQVEYTTAGTYNWVVPAGVTSVSVVAVGGGNGAGSQATSTGTSHFNNTLYAYGSNGRNGGSYAGADGGGAGGLGGQRSSYTYFNETAGENFTRHRGGGGGGAGGYSGNGGNGGRVTGSATSDSGAGGGGVGIYGQGANGAAGASGTSGTTSGAGGGGGGGAAGSSANAATGAGGGGSGGQNGYWSTSDPDTPNGGLFGGGQAGHGRLNNSSRDGYGGGGLGYKNNITVAAGQTIPIKVGAGGAVRIIWPGDARQFPGTRTANE